MTTGCEGKMKTQFAIVIKWWLAEPSLCLLENVRTADRLRFYSSLSQRWIAWSSQLSPVSLCANWLICWMSSNKIQVNYKMLPNCYSMPRYVGFYFFCFFVGGGGTVYLAYTEYHSHWVLWPIETQSPGSWAAVCSPPKGANCPKCLYLEKDYSLSEKAS